MNSGIYALYWWEQDLVYVGLSQNIDNRRKEHFTSMRNNRHTNYKVQNTFNQYGEPEFIILEYCSISELLEKEVQWCTEFDALGSHGLCLVEPGIVGFGSNSNASKYAKNQILKVFQLLYRSNLSYIQISKRLSISFELVKDISNGYSHSWLKDTYPEEYSKMLNTSRRTIGARSNSKVYQEYIIQPDNKIIYVTNLYDTVEKYFNCQNSNDIKNTVEGLRRVLSGSRPSYRGYKKYTGVVA